MTHMFTGAGEILEALGSGDSWMLGEAMRQPAIWPLGLAAMLTAAAAVLLVYQYLPWVERHLESSVMVVSYLAIGGIIFVEVFRRFVLEKQAPWSTTLPPFLFLIMTWFGCAYNVRRRSHLAFAEFRSSFGPGGQLACLCLDAVLWIGFAWIVVVSSTRVVVNSAANFQILLGTDNVMQWWFLISVPLAFTLLVARVLENLRDDIANYRSGAPLVRQIAIGGD